VPRLGVVVTPLVFLGSRFLPETLTAELELISSSGPDESAHPLSSSVHELRILASNLLLNKEAVYTVPEQVRSHGAARSNGQPQL
jgi:hypothetical protein